MNALIQNESPSLEQRARRRVALKKSWLVHASVYLLVNAGLFLLGIAHGGRDIATLPLFGWGIGLAIHGIVVLARLHGEGLDRRWIEREAEALRRREDRRA